MATKIYLDANIVLDFLSPERSKHPESKKVMDTLIRRGDTIVISEDILTTVYYIAKNKRKAVAFFKLIQHRWEIVHFGDQVIAAALDRVLVSEEDLEDTLQCLCAKQEACTLIVTEDRDFVDCGVEVLDYEGFLS